MTPRPAPRILAEKILAAGWGTLSSSTITLAHSDGADRTFDREVYDHGSAAAILLLDPGHRIVTLVRQFRFPAHLNGDAPYLLEACAGLLDGDTPEICATKEAMEETGIAPSEIRHAFDIYASPGSLTEKIHCFIGFHDRAGRIGKGGGLDHESEDIEIVEIGFDSALNLIETGAIIDAKTVALIQHAALKGLLA